MFRVFVGWLYCHNIFYDTEQKEPRQFAAEATSTRPKTKIARRKAKTDVKQSAADDGSSELPSLESAEESADDASRRRSAKASDKRKVSQPKPTSGHPPGGSNRKYHQEDEVTNGDDADLPDECDYREPTTWTFEWLFSLYIFAEKYNIRDFWVDILDIIQMKMYQTKPGRYLLPPNSTMIHAVDNLPPRSPLYRLLVDCW